MLREVLFLSFTAAESKITLILPVLFFLNFLPDAFHI